MNRQNTKSGFAHLMIITVILGLGLVGALGFVFYQNFTQNKSNAVDRTTDNSKTNDTATDKIEDNTAVISTDKTDSNTTAVSTNKIYSGDTFNFEYPNTSWEVKAGASNSSVSIETTDYKTGPMSVEQGSSVTVGLLQYYNSASEMITSYKAKGMISKVDNITVDGQVAYKFSCYEFCSYDTVFDKNGASYRVTLNSANGSNVEVYNTVLSTLKIK